MLVITQQDGLSVKSIPRIPLSDPVTHWIYLGEDSTWRIRAEEELSLYLKRISIADILDEVTQELRQQYLDWIGSLSVKNASLEWWASELAAKNPYYHLFFRICLLSAIKKILGKKPRDSILIICSSHEILRQVISFAKEDGIAYVVTGPGILSGNRPGQSHSFISLAKTIAGTLPTIATVGKYLSPYQKFLESDLRYRKKILADNYPVLPEEFRGEKTALFFTWIDRRSFGKDDTFTDPYFGPLPGFFRDRGYSVAFVPQVLFTIPFKEAVERMVKTGETAFFPELFLSPPDMNLQKRRAAEFCPDIPLSDMVGSIPVSGLAREHIETTRHILADMLRFDPMIRNMHAQGINPSQIIHTCEGHSWEQALAWSVHTYMPGTKVTAYDNVTFSRMVLSMYPAGSETSIRPLPDRIVTNGPLFRQTLIREGYPEEKISTGCAIRHTYLWNSSPKPRAPLKDKKDEPVNILAATAIGLGDSVELVGKAADAFGGNPKYRIRIKCHPLVNPDEVRKYLGTRAEHPNIRFETAAVGELLKTADVLLYTYTSVCYEALRYGVKPICVRSENFLNLDKLDATPEIRWLATSPDDLQEAVADIAAMTSEDDAQWNENAQRIVRDALAPVSEAGIDAFLFS